MADDVDANLLIGRDVAEALQAAAGADEGDSASWDDAFLNRRTGGGEGVFDPGLALFELDLGSRSDLDHGNAAGQLGHPLLELLPVEFRSGVFDLGFDLVNPALDGFFGALALNDGGLVLGGRYAAGGPEVFDGCGVQFLAGLLTDNGAAGEDGDVFQHGLPPVAETRGLDGQNAEGAAERVDHQGSQSFAVHVLGDDHDVLLADLEQFLQGGKHVGHGRYLLVGDDDGGVFQHRLHAVGVGDEVRGDVTTVDLHPLYIFDLVGQAFGLFNGDDAVFADLFHGFSDGLADGFFVGGEAGNLADALSGFHHLGHSLDFRDNRRNCFLNPTLDGHGVCAGGDVFESLVDDGLGQYNGGGGAIARGIVGLGGGLFQKLRAHVFKCIGQFDLFSDGNAVAADLGRAKGLVQNHVTAFGSKGDFH